LSAAAAIVSVPLQITLSRRIAVGILVSRLTNAHGVVILHCNQAIDFVEEVSRLPSGAGVTDAIRRGFDRFGIESFALVNVPKEHEVYEDVVLAVHEPAALLETMRDNNYFHASPALRHCGSARVPFVWKDAPYDRHRERRVVEVVRLFADFGLLNSIMIPVRSRDGGAGGAWLTGRGVEITAHHMPAVCLIAVYAFEHLRKFASRLPPLAKSALTARERDVLAWAAHGKSAWEIGEILGIAKRTVDEHTQTAMRKLGAVNKTQAVAIAMRDRYIAL